MNKLEQFRRDDSDLWLPGKKRTVTSSTANIPSLSLDVLEQTITTVNERCPVWYIASEYTQKRQCRKHTQPLEMPDGEVKQVPVTDCPICDESDQGVLFFAFLNGNDQVLLVHPANVEVLREAIGSRLVEYPQERMNEQARRTALEWFENYKPATR